ncbi:MAG: tyrosine-type recombinase/integrase [Bdellovibrionales bacterium]|nr:tyrosine-type recombinase/integrase [Bdellovibrionales bacterium]
MRVQVPSPAPQEVAAPARPVAELFVGDLINPGPRLRSSMEGFFLDQRSEHTRRAYSRDLKRFLQYLLVRAETRGRDETLDRGVVVGFKEALLADGLQPSSIDRRLAALKSLFAWLVEDGHLARSPADAVRFLNAKRLSRTQGFTDEEVRRILALPDLHTRAGAMHYAVLMTLFYCGLRRSELCALRSSNLTLERGKRVLRLMGKGGRERIVVMPEPVWNGLRYLFVITRRDLRVDQFLFTAARKRSVLGTVAARPLDPSSIYDIVVRYARKAGIQSRVSPHSCRATAISNARDRQVPDRAIQEFAGWSTPNMIVQYDKRRTAVDQSASLAIDYGDAARRLPAWGAPSGGRESDPDEEVAP